MQLSNACPPGAGRAARVVGEAFGEELHEARNARGLRQMMEAAKNGIMIFGPKSDGMYAGEFRTAKSESLAISVPSRETAVLQHFQAQMPYGLFVPDAQNW